MRLSGAWSNQIRFAVVRKAAEARLKLTTKQAKKSSNPPIRLRQGVLQDTMLTVRRQHGRALRPKEVQLHVEYQLECDVSYVTGSRFLVVCRLGD